MNRSKVRAFDAMVARYPDSMPLDVIMRGNRVAVRLWRARQRQGWGTWRLATLLEPGPTPGFTSWTSAALTATRVEPLGAGVERG